MTTRLLAVLAVLGVAACGAQPDPVFTDHRASDKAAAVIQSIRADLQAKRDRLAADARADLAREMAAPKWRRSIERCEARPSCIAQTRLNVMSTEPDAGPAIDTSYGSWQLRRQLGWIDDDLGRIQTRLDDRW